MDGIICVVFVDGAHTAMAHDTHPMKKKDTIRNKLINEAATSAADYADFWKRRVDKWLEEAGVRKEEMEAFEPEERKKP